MPYDLGVDLGTTYTAAAVSVDGRLEMLSLGNRALQVPSVLFVTPEGDLAVGDTAERRGATEPNRLVREFKRRIGDRVPILVGGMPFSAQALMARLVGWVVDTATERQGEPPRSVTLTYPANWGPFKTDLFEQAIHLADVQDAQIITEPEAAAVTYASRSRLEDGDRIAVYDLGGGTFDAAVLQREGDGFRILGTPEGIEHLGGVDFDEAIFRSAMPLLEDAVAKVDRDDPGVAMALTRLRRDCVEAKEALSSETEAVVPIVLPGITTSVRFTRGEFEDLIRVPLGETVAAMTRVLRSADTTPEELRSIVLMGGSSRIPLVSEMLVAEFGRPLALDAHPKHDVALGAALVGAATTIEALPGPAPVPKTAPKTGTAPPPEIATAPPPTTAPVDPDESGARKNDPPAQPRPTASARPASPPPPPRPRTLPSRTPSRRTITVVGASLVGLLLATGGAFLLFGGPHEATTTATTGRPTSSSPTTSAAVLNLPTSPKLKDSQLVVARRINGKPNIFLIDVNDPSALRQLTTDGHPIGSMTLAPTRKTVAYVRYIDRRGSVQIMAANGDGKRALFARPIDGCDNVEHVAWDPSDVAQLVVSCRDAAGHANKLLVVGVDGHVRHQLDTGSMYVSDPAISHDGTKVAYWSDKSFDGGGDIFTVPMDGTTPGLPLTQGVAGSDFDPVWHPDGKIIAFCRKSVGGTTPGNVDIWSVDVRTGKVEPLVQNPAADDKPGWSPDGIQLIFVSNRSVRAGEPVGADDLWVMTVTPRSQPRSLGVPADHITTPAWGNR